MATEMGACGNCGELLWQSDGQPEQCNDCLAKAPKGKTIATPAYDLAREAARLTDERRADKRMEPRK